MPPVQVVEGNENEDGYKPHIEGIRFPKWLQCTSCDLLDQAHRFESEIGDPSRWCAKCSAKQGKRVHVFPVRFITMCENGHISDFQWSYYYSRLKNCSCGSTKIYLKSDGNSSALESLYLTCYSDKCKDNKVSLKHIFDGKFLSGLGIKCSGERPWIGDSEDCSCTISTSQRGASNTYFPKIESALSIPPWDNPLEKIQNINWTLIRNLSPEDRKLQLEIMAPNFSMPPDELVSLVERRIDYIENASNVDLKIEEYLNFIEATETPDGTTNRSKDFRVRKQQIPENLIGHFSSIVKVERLKEVQVLVGFTRINPPVANYDPDDEKSLSFKIHDWLPSSRVLGEGVFLALDDDRIKKWRMHKTIQQRSTEILEAFRSNLESQGQNYDEQDIKVTPEFILLHTLSHLLIQQLSLTSGYNAASIRERIYCGGDNPNMKGVLIFTGTSDSDGTLGGLSRLAESDLFVDILVGAVNEAKWCSSDPLCYDGILSTSETLNKAACHSCALLPETSCSYFNRFLDRSFVVGLPDEPSIGYFSSLIGENLMPAAEFFQKF